MVRDCSTYPVIIYERMRHLATSLLTVYRRQDVVILCLYRHVSLASADVCQADFTQCVPGSVHYYCDDGAKIIHTPRFEKGLPQRCTVYHTLQNTSDTIYMFAREF